MSNLHKRPPVGERRVRQFRVNPPDPNKADSQVKFTAKLNQQFSLISDELTRLPKFPKGYSIDDYARKDEVEEIIDRLDEQAFDLVSSEGDEEVDVGAGRRAAQARSSRRRHRAAQAAEAAATAALESARPLVAPPEIEDVSNIGTANTPPRFSYEDHTHSGVNLGDAQTITGLKTFDRDPAAPFAVTSGSAKVNNLRGEMVTRKNSGGADFVRGRINFIEGTDITISMSDDAGNDEIDLTINSTPGTATQLRAFPILIGTPMPMAQGTARRPNRGTYGTASDVPVITVDANGRVTALTTTPLGSGTEMDPTFKKHMLFMGG